MSFKKDLIPVSINGVDLQDPAKHIPANHVELVIRKEEDFATSLRLLKEIYTYYTDIEQTHNPKKEIQDFLEKHKHILK